MKVMFLSVGEAFDKDLPNTSLLILSKTKMMIDCGYSMPNYFWRYTPDPEFLDVVYISHKHADHYFGLPALLTRMWEQGRKKNLTIICQKGMKDVITNLMEMAYPGFMERFFPIEFKEIDENSTVELNEFVLTFAPTAHTCPNLAIRLVDKERAIVYSGDGMFTEQSERLYAGADLLVHEAYLLSEKKEGHATVSDVLAVAKRQRVKSVALVHLNREYRVRDIKVLRKMLTKETPKTIVPEPFEEVYF